MMDKTRTKPSFIKPVKENYANLKEEILDLHNQSDNQDDSQLLLEQELLDVKQKFEDIKHSVNSVNNNIIEEVTTARGPYLNLNDRLDKMSGYELLKKFETLSTSKTYTYDDQERITNVSVRGDVSFDILYIYDENSNIKREERYDIDGNLIGYKDYTFDDIGQIITESGENTDDVITATTSLITEELDKRITTLEDIDFVKLAQNLSIYDIEYIYEILQEVQARVQHAEMYLPENQGQLIEISSVLDRLETLEHRLNYDYVIYSFYVTTDKVKYSIPSTVPNNASIYLEGLLLSNGDDYIIEDESITFLIPLIDDFTITCKY